MSGNRKARIRNAVNRYSAKKRGVALAPCPTCRVESEGALHSMSCGTCGACWNREGAKTLKVGDSR